MGGEGGGCLGIGVTRSLQCLLFLPMGQLVSRHLVIFSVIYSSKTSHSSLPLSPSKYVIFNVISIIRRGGSEDSLSHSRRRPDTRSGGSKRG